MQTSTQARDSYNAKLKELWRHICNLNEEQRKQVVNSLDEEILRDLRSLPNLFRKPVVSVNSKAPMRMLAFNVINLREKYCRRFAMTSLIGFIYRMLSEYVPPGADKFMSENDPKFADIFHKKVREAERRIPETRLEAAGDTEALNALRRFYTNEEKKEFVAAAEVARREIMRLTGELQKAKDNAVAMEKRYAGRILYEMKSNKYEPSEEQSAILARTGEQPSLIEDTRQNLESFAQIYRNALAAIDRISANLAKAEAELKEKTEKVDELSAILGKDPVMPIDRYELTEEEEDVIVEEVKRELNIEQTAEDYIAKVQDDIEAFLNEYFRFNPDEHVRCSYKPNYKDPVRNVLNPSVVPDDVPERKIIPPDDTFFRWNRYIDNNYEALRQATDDIYCEKSDLEFAIAPLEVFEGTKEECEKEFNNYKRKYNDEFDADVYASIFNNWNLLSSWEENRKSIDFYNEHTEIIKRIIDQHKDDERIGTKLMKSRASKKKKELEKKESQKKPITPVEAKNARKNLEPHAAKLRSYGAKHVSEVKVDDYVIPKDNQEASEQEVEVNVHVIKPVRRKRRLRGLTEQWHFNIPAKPLPEDSVVVKTAADVEK